MTPLIFTGALRTSRLTSTTPGTVEILGITKGSLNTAPRRIYDSTTAKPPMPPPPPPPPPILWASAGGAFQGDIAADHPQ